jgi:hypothetical protein
MPSWAGPFINSLQNEMEAHMTGRLCHRSYLAVLEHESIFWRALAGDFSLAKIETTTTIQQHNEMRLLLVKKKSMRVHVRRTVYREEKEHTPHNG